MYSYSGQNELITLGNVFLQWLDGWVGGYGRRCAQDLANL